MKHDPILSARSWFAVILVASLLVSFGIYSGEILVPIAAFSTAGIAAFDSSHIHLWRYRTALSYGPIGLFVVSALIWPVVLIWYFIVRVRIARGTMPLKKQFRPRQSAS